MMNERIRELAFQAMSINQNVSDDSFFVEVSKLKEFEKFAELIVRECLSVGEDVANADGEGPWFEGYISGVEEVNRRIKQHFGVEE